jgi:hypothetical protein
MFVGKAKSTPLKGSFFYMLDLGRLQPFLQVLGSAGKALAYYKHSKITDVKSFITLGPGPDLIKLFTAVF